ncbi:MAG: hypothetical protein M0031_09425 [Thermaerobacter sp.]|nr:hypothetical protein [Thermaerobacter sp.]
MSKTLRAIRAVLESEVPPALRRLLFFILALVLTGVWAWYTWR